MRIEDLNVIKNTLEKQTKEFNRLIIIAIKILESTKQKKFVGQEYIIEEINEEIIICEIVKDIENDEEEEILRGKLANNQFEILRSCLVDRNIVDLQDILINLVT